MPIPINTNFKGDGYIRPRDDISPKKKQEDPKYSLEYSQFIYGQHMSENTAIKHSNIELFRENRLYAEGRQSGARYKERFLGKSTNPQMRTTDVDTASNDLGTAQSMQNILEGLTNINYDEIFSPLPKYVSTIIGLITSQEHDVTVEAEDEVSGTMREEMKFDKIVRKEHEGLLKIYNETFNLPGLEDQTKKPESLDEIELYENIGAFKLPYEIAMEKGISHTEYISNDDNIKEEVIRDLITIGVSPVVTFVNPETGKVRYEWKDIEDVILEDSNKNDFSDASYGAYVEYVTIVNLRAQTGWSEEELLKVIENNGGATNYSGVQKPNGSYEYDDYKVAVLVCFWKSIDSEYTTNRKTKNGTTEFPEPYTQNGTKPPKTGKKGARDTSRTDIRRLYKSRWIIGTEKVYDYGLMHNIPYNYAKRDVEFPIHMVKVKGKPIMESLKTIEDQIMLAYIRMQNDIATANPQGINIEIGSLENISYGNKKLKPKDVLSLYTHTGVLLTRLAPSSIPGPNNKPVNQRPVSEIKGGLGPAIADAIINIRFNILNGLTTAISNIP